MLGSGTSQGVPAIGCECAVCRSTDPRDRRTRPSILIELQEGGSRAPFAQTVRSILVDTSTDLRAQALANDVRRVDAILFTHGHADHVLGLDEMRRYNQMQKTPIGCYANAGTVADLRRMFSYVFSAPRQKGGGVPQLRLFSIAGPFTMGGAEIVPVPLWHGELPVLGFRVGSFAYMTDCNRIPEESWPLLEGRPRGHHRRAARPSPLDALQRVRSARRGLADRARTSVLHAHLPRPAARRHLRAPARRCAVGL